MTLKAEQKGIASLRRSARNCGHAPQNWRRLSVLRKSILIAATVLLAAIDTTPLAAQGNAGSGAGSYITPFPKGDVYRLRAYGDYYADGVSYGLADAFKNDKRVQVIKNYGRFRAVIRARFNTTLKRHLNELQNKPIEIAVIMMGGNDRGHIRFPDGARLKLGTPAWRRAYARRIDQIIKGFAGKGAAVYWVGLPILRQQRANKFAKFINELIRERVYLNGARFIDVYGAFANEQGEYDRNGPDISGKIKKLRDRDGETFTAAGNRKLAHFVAGEIKRDLAQASADRAVPLAGSKADQQRINPERQQAEATIKKGWNSKVKKVIKGGRTSARHGAAQRKTLAQRADNSKVALQVLDQDGKTKTVSIKILRPAIPAAIIALVTRKESGDKPSNIGDAVPGILQGGLTVLSTITPARLSLGAGGHRRLPPTHTLYYRVLIKGETLPPKPGRSDDIRWPRPGVKAANRQQPGQRPLLRQRAQAEQTGKAAEHERQKRARRQRRQDLPRG